MSFFAKPLREKVWGFELMMRLEEDTMIVSCDFSRPLSDFFKPLSVVMSECGIDCGAASHDEVRRFDFEFLHIRGCVATWKVLSVEPGQRSNLSRSNSSKFKLMPV